MNDEDKTREQLLEELVELRRRIAAWEAEDHGRGNVPAASGRVVDGEAPPRDQLQAILTAANERLRQEVEERRRTEESLRQSHGELQATYDGMVDGLLIADLETKRFVKANASICGMLGYTEDELLSMSVKDIHPPEEVPKVLEKFQAVGDGSIVRSENRRVLKKDGTLFYADVRARRIDYRGRPSLIGFFRDITERKRVEEALRVSEERFRVVFEEAPVGIVIGVDGGILVKANRAVCRMGGYHPEEVTGRCYREFTHPEDMEPSVEQVGRLLAGEIDSFTIQKRYRKKDGGFFWGQTTMVAVKDPAGKVAIALGIIEDITDRKRAEEALRQSFDQLRTIYDGMIEGLLITDIETKRFVRVNASLCRMLGYSEEELLAASIKDIHPAAEVPNDLQRFQAAADGRISLNEDRPVLRKDGSIFYADITGHRIRYEGRPCLLALFRDVTERRRAQEALRRERRTLAHMLEASDHERQLIAYDIHDGLAQQLAGAIMQFQVHEHLKDAKPRQAVEAYRAGMTMLRQGHSESRRLISGVRPPILDESGVVAAIAHLVNDRTFEGGPKVEFRSNIAFNRLTPILENAVYRIVQEGLTNAHKHSKSERVRVGLRQKGERVRIEIRDWGIGFDVKAAPENRFGLPGIRQRARLLGGTFRISSKPAKGTAIVVELPVVERRTEE